jgi:hypothetical protein
VPRRSRSRRRHGSSRQGGRRHARWGRSCETRPQPHSSLRFPCVQPRQAQRGAGPRDDAGRRDLLRLVASADFVFENAGPGALDARGLGFDALRQVRPDLVYVALSPFGNTGPYAGHLATDLTLAAMGGAMALNGDRRPAAGADHRAADVAPRCGRERARRAGGARASSRDRATRSSSTCRCRRPCSGRVSRR